MVLVLLEIRQRNLKDSALQSIVCVLETGSSVDQSLSDAICLLDDSSRYYTEGDIVLSDIEGGGSLDLIPVFASKRILGLLLETFFAL